MNTANEDGLGTRKAHSQQYIGNLTLLRGKLRPKDDPQTPLACSYILVSLESRVLVVIKTESYKLPLNGLPAYESQFHFRTV